MDVRNIVPDDERQDRKHTVTITIITNVLLYRIHVRVAADVLVILSHPPVISYTPRINMPLCVFRRTTDVQNIVIVKRDCNSVPPLRLSAVLYRRTDTIAGAYVRTSETDVVYAEEDVLFMAALKAYGNCVPKQ
jgi:hypothetical protein